jgi:Flp pilus assembly protein TadG
MSTVQRKFKRDSRGAVAVIFAVCAVVVFGAAGMAVDFINASGVRASLQQALDGAVLAAAAAHVKNENEAEEVIAEYMASNWSLKYPSSMRKSPRAGRRRPLTEGPPSKCPP